MPKVNELIRLVLDTHVWVWLLNGNQNQLHPNRIEQIEQAAEQEAVYLSTISLWEVAMLEAKNRLQFPIGCQQWLKQAVSVPGIRLVMISPEIAIDSTRLPGDFHGDPADRLITATTRQLQATLITADKKILRYAATGRVQAIAC